MKKALLLALVCLLLTGCAPSNTYISVVPHQEHGSGSSTQEATVSNVTQLKEAVEELVEQGEQHGIIFVPNYDQNRLEEDLKAVTQLIQRENPVAAYAVKSMDYELGTNSGQSAVALAVGYIHTKSEIRNIVPVDDMEQAKEKIRDALRKCNTSLVLRIESYRQTDFEQFVEDYMESNPNLVMELPTVSVSVYPDNSQTDQVVELTFTYQTNRDSLRNMQIQVQRIFDSAALYVSMDAEDFEKYDQLYSFLMERFDYDVETSITPYYSLLRHGVGDSETLAVVFAAMCRASELECQVVSGTRDGEAWHWNLIRDGEQYYHVDLLRSAQTGALQVLTDGMMNGYVWDYSRIPAAEDIPEPTEPVEEPVPEQPDEPVTEPTEPAEETEPTKGTEPTKATEPDNGTEPTKGTEPPKNTEPPKGTEPPKNTEPPKPAETTTPATNPKK